jgi:hypothetical protein
VEEAITFEHPDSIKRVIDALRYCGVEPYIAVGDDDFAKILAAGGRPFGDDRVRFSPEQVAGNEHVSPRIRSLMRRLIDEVW